jgi:hypothetical protein
MARTFKHNDPIGWTKKNRPAILAAIYTVIMGNPFLDTPMDTSTKTRFPMWYRMVGSALEHAVGCYRELYPDAAVEEVSFENLFLKQKSGEAEGTSLSEMLDALDTLMRKWFERQVAWANKKLDLALPGDAEAGEKATAAQTALERGTYTAKEITACLNDEHGPEEIATVRGFLFQKVPLGDKLSPLAVGQALARLKDKRRPLNGEILTFRAEKNRKDVCMYQVKRAKA